MKLIRPGEGQRERRPSKYGEGGRNPGGQARRANLKFGVKPKTTFALPPKPITPVEYDDLPEPGGHPAALTAKATASGKKLPDSPFLRLKQLHQSQHAALDSEAEPGEEENSPLSANELFAPTREVPRPTRTREELLASLEKLRRTVPILRRTTKLGGIEHEEGQQGASNGSGTASGGGSMEPSKEGTRSTSEAGDGPTTPGLSDVRRAIQQGGVDGTERHAVDARDRGHVGPGASHAASEVANDPTASNQRVDENRREDIALGHQATDALLWQPRDVLSLRSTSDGENIAEGIDAPGSKKAKKRKVNGNKDSLHSDRVSEQRKGGYNPNTSSLSGGELSGVPVGEAAMDYGPKGKGVNAELTISSGGIHHNSDSRVHVGIHDGLERKAVDVNAHSLSDGDRLGVYLPANNANVSEGEIRKTEDEGSQEVRGASIREGTSSGYTELPRVRAGTTGQDTALLREERNGGWVGDKGVEGTEELSTLSEQKGEVTNEIQLGAATSPAGDRGDSPHRDQPIAVKMAEGKKQVDGNTKAHTTGTTFRDPNGVLHAVEGTAPPSQKEKGKDDRSEEGLREGNEGRLFFRTSQDGSMRGQGLPRMPAGGDEPSAHGLKREKYEAKTLSTSVAVEGLGDPQTWEAEDETYHRDVRSSGSTSDQSAQNQVGQPERRHLPLLSPALQGMGGETGQPPTGTSKDTPPVSTRGAADAETFNTLPPGPSGNSSIPTKGGAPEERDNHTKYNERQELEVGMLLGGIPGVTCNTCSVAEKCPSFKENSTCEYDDYFSGLSSRNIDNLLPRMEVIADLHFKRATRAVFVEARNAGGQILPEVTRQLEVAATAAQRVATLKTPQQRGMSAPLVVVNNQPATEGGILARMFAGIAPARPMLEERKSGDIVINMPEEQLVGGADGDEEKE